MLGGSISATFQEYVLETYPNINEYFQSTELYNSDYSGRNKGDLWHFAATLSGLIHESNFSSGFQYGVMPENVIDDLAGWAGDYQQSISDDILEHRAEYDDYESMYQYAYNVFFADGTSFDKLDLNSDVDALNISKLNDGNESISSSMRSYYLYRTQERFTMFSENADYSARADMYSCANYGGGPNFFWTLRWPLFGSNTIDELNNDQWDAIRDAFIDLLDSYISEEN